MLAALDVGVANTTPTADLVERGRAAERLGFGRLWLAEQHHYRGAIAQAAAIAGATTSMEIGFGILSPFVRHPAVIAMEAAALAEHWGERFIVGLGGAHGMLRAHGLDVPVPAGLDEAGQVLQRLFRGEQVVSRGPAFPLPAPGVVLDSAPWRVPVQIGSLGPRTLRTAAAHMDGAILGVLCSPDFVADRVETLERALDEHDRDRSAFEISGLFIFSVDEDAEAARHAARAAIAFYLHEIPDPTPRTVGTGLERLEILAVGESIRSAGAQAGVDLVPEHFIDHLAIAGTPDHCRSRLERYAAAGLDRAVLYHTLGPTPTTALELVARELTPKLVRPQSQRKD